jgi:type II secretion system protein D
MLWATDAGAYQPPTKTDPKTEVKPAEEPTYEFAMSGKPWKDVFAWLNEKTELPIVGVAVPTGTFHITGPANRKYNMGEVIDIINAGLLSNEDKQKYFLIRREREFVLLAADQKNYEGLVPLVKLADLSMKKFGKTQMVMVVVPLTSLVAEEVKDEVGKMLSPFGKVDSLKPNSLRIADQVSNIEHILDVLDQTGKAEHSDSYSHTCKYVRAAEVERQLKELLPDPEKIAKLNTPAPTPGQDPRFAPRTPVATTTKPKIYAISSDDVRNTIIVTGPADIIAKAQDLVEKKIDVGTRPILTGEAKFTTYQIGGGNAEAWAVDLRKVFPETASLRITAAGNNALRIYATPQVHEEIQSKIGLTDERGIKTKMIYVGTLDAVKVADMLVKWLGEATKGAPNIEAVTDSNAIAVHGNQAQIDEVEAIVKTLNATGGVGGMANMRVLTLEKGSGVSVAEEIERIMKDLGTNPIKRINPGGETAPPIPSKPIREMDKAPEQSRLDGDGSTFVKYQPPERFVDPRKQDPAPPASGKAGAPVTIAAAGNKIIITSEDPAALAAAVAIYKLLTQTSTTEGDFSVIKLQNASAIEAAKVLDEAFNGKQQPQQGGRGNRGGGFNPFGGGGAAPVANPIEDRIRVVADPNTNSLLIRAKPVDLLTIRRLIRDQIDNPEVNSAALQKPWRIGPLKNTSAAEVVVWLKEIYGQQTGTTARSSDVGGFRGFAFGGGGQSTQQPAQATANSLAIGHDERTNTLLVLCNEKMYKNIETLVQTMDLAAKDYQKTIRVVSIQNVDPQMLQQALSIFGAATGSQQQRQPGSQQPGGSQQGGNPGGFNPGGFNPGSGQPGMGQPTIIQPGFPTRGGGGGGFPRGGTGMSAPTQPSGGPAFFADRVKDDPELNDVFFDPHHIAAVEQQTETSGTPVGSDADRAPAPLQQIRFDEPKAQPQPMQPMLPVQAGEPIVGPRGTINSTTLSELGLFIISGNTPQDVAEIIKVIEEIRKYSEKAGVVIEMVQLKQGDATAITNYLNLLYQRVVLQANGNSPTLAGPRTTTTQGVFAQISQTQTPPASVALLALPRFNAILIAAPKSQIDNVKKEVERLDKPNSPEAQFVPFQLKTTSAARVTTLLNNFWNQRYGTSETAAQHQVRIFSEDKTNSVLVQAAPADMEEIARLIKHIDTTDSIAVNDIRIVHLNSAFSDDLAALLQKAINDGVMLPTTTPGAPATPGPGLPAAPAAFGAPAAAAARPATGATGSATKAYTLKFVSRLGTAATGILEDIHLTSDPRTNSLIVSAPEKTMELLLRLIVELDQPPSAKAVIKVYTLKKGDATTMATMLQQLFLGTTTGGAGGGPAAPAGGFPGPAGATSTTARPLQFSLNGVTPEGTPLIDVRVTVDNRTNSIIYAGSENDVRIIEALLSKLDGSDVEVRHNEVILLKNSNAADVANAMNNFISGNLGVLSRGSQLQPFQDYMNEVVVVPEPITNKLLISATPRYFPDVMKMVEELDAEPPQVVIQVMIAEVDLTGSEEFGVEIGLQSPVLFQRGVIPFLPDFGTGTTSFANAAGGLITPGVTVSGVVNPTAQPGFAFTNTTLPLGNNPAVSPGVVGFQGVSSLGVGRTSSLNPGGPGGLVLSAGSDSFNILVRALKTQGRLDILSTTKVMTVDNQSAGILVGSSVPYITGSTVSTLGTVTNSVAYRNVGVQMTVTPKISPDGKVIMRVLPEVSKIDTATAVSIGNGTTAVAFDVQNVETTVLAQDGETVAIGGLIQKTDIKNETKVPWLGDLPGVGTLFRYRTQSKSKQELIVILTPHIVRNRLERQQILCDDSRRMNWCLGDVEKMYGPLGLENCPPAGCGHAVDGALPTHPVMPGAPIQIAPVIETIPAAPTAVPNVVPGSGPMMPPRPQPQAQMPAAQPNPAVQQVSGPSIFTAPNWGTEDARK